jgi:hypothetical protein
MANAQLQAYWAELEKQRGLPPGYLARTRMIESGGNPNAVSPTGPVGPFQFTKKTALAFGLPLNQRTDEYASARAAADYAAQNRGILAKALGRNPEGHELYMGHQQGGPGAAKLLTNPGAAAGSLVPRTNISFNAGDPNAPASNILEKFKKRYLGSGASTAVAGAPATVPPNAVAPTMAANAPQAPATAPVAAMPGPDQPGPIIGRGQGLVGLLNSDKPITREVLSNFMGGPEVKSAVAGAGQLAQAMAPAPARPVQFAPIQAEDAHMPDITPLLQRVKKRKGYV